MDVSELLDAKLGYRAKSKFRGAGWESLHGLTLDEERTDPLLASLFWQSVLGSGHLDAALQKAGASPLAMTTRERFVISHSKGSRFNLIVFDPGYRGDPVAVEVRATPEQLLRGWERFRRSFRGSRLVAPPYLIDERAVLEAGKADDYGVVLSEVPTVEFTSAPRPALSMTGARSASVGVLATDKLGRSGFTTARHAVIGSGRALGASVTVSTPSGIVTGTVVEEDAITDSAFVEIAPGTILGSTTPVAGPLRGRTPTSYQSAEFDGVTSGLTSTSVTGWSPELPFFFRGSQLKILTKPDTAPGDSGAALLDDPSALGLLGASPHVLGFAFYRTGFGATVGFAAWIWAESVYDALGLL